MTKHWKDKETMWLSSWIGEPRCRFPNKSHFPTFLLICFLISLIRIYKLSYKTLMNTFCVKIVVLYLFSPRDLKDSNGKQFLIFLKQKVPEYKLKLRSVLIWVIHLKCMYMMHKDSRHQSNSRVRPTVRYSSPNLKYPWILNNKLCANSSGLTIQLDRSLRDKWI